MDLKEKKEDAWGGGGRIMGQTLTRYLANIRLRIINGTLFLCTSLMCSFMCQAQSQAVRI